MAVGELPQQLAERGRAYTSPNNRAIPPEPIKSKSSMQSAPAAIPVMTAVSFPAGFAPRRRHPRRLEHHLVGDQLYQAGLLGQPHHWDQAGARDQTLVIEDRDRPRPAILQFHSRCLLQLDSIRN